MRSARRPAFALLLSLAVSCGGGGGGPHSCDVTSCGGCCDATGRCLSGVTELACGLNGVTCAACESTQSCSAGLCREGQAGGAGGGSAGGGSAGGGSAGGGSAGGGSAGGHGGGS